MISRSSQSLDPHLVPGVMEKVSHALVSRTKLNVASRHMTLDIDYLILRCAGYLVGTRLVEVFLAKTCESSSVETSPTLFKKQGK